MSLEIINKMSSDIPEKKKKLPKKQFLRRSSAIAPFGVGAMSNFPDAEVLIAASTRLWAIPVRRDALEAGLILRDERLEHRLRVGYFRIPPSEGRDLPGINGDEDELAPKPKLPFFRFPQWHYCVRCGDMKRLSLTVGSKEYRKSAGRCVKEGCRGNLLQSRYVVVCENGHLDDFPYAKWVHRGADSPSCNNGYRMFNTANSGTVTGAIIQCKSCNAQRSIAGALSREEGLSSINVKCTGKRPWEGEDGPGGTTCSCKPNVLNRSASNVYFPVTVSSLYLPSANSAVQIDSEAKAISAVFDDFWDAIVAPGSVDHGILKVLCSTRGVTNIARAIEMAESRQAEFKAEGPLDDAPLSEELYRSHEYYALSSGVTNVESKELSLTKIPVEGRYKLFVSDHFEEIILVNKLRETRALVGFTRHLPSDGNWTSRRVQRVKNQKHNWLPAIAAHGEGVFFKLNEKRLLEWESRPAVVERIANLNARYNAARLARELPERHVSPKFVLIHTLSHLLINQMAYDCGYGSSSLRERIYCNSTQSGPVMSGMLIYTSSSDAEGTLGGLVRQGRPRLFDGLLERAINKSRWCSSDPICVELDSQGPDGCNLAACHSCALLAETSCEESNKLLDRAMVVGTISDPEIGFFEIK